MSSQEFQWARDALMRRQEDLRREVSAAGEATRERQAFSAHEVLDQKDQASERSESAVDDGSLLRDLEELRQIQAARERLEQGRYGLCIDCGEPIDAQRLHAQP